MLQHKIGRLSRSIFSDHNLRVWVIPILMGAVWVISFLISDRLSLLGSSVWTFILKLCAAFNIALLFELLLMQWDINLSLKKYILHRDHSFRLQCRTVPFMIAAPQFGILAMEGSFWTILYVSILFCAKTAMHHSVSSVDKLKSPINFSLPERF